MKITIPILVLIGIARVAAADKPQNWQLVAGLNQPLLLHGGNI